MSCDRLPSTAKRQSKVLPVWLTMSCAGRPAPSLCTESNSAKFPAGRHERGNHAANKSVLRTEPREAFGLATKLQPWTELALFFGVDQSSFGFAWHEGIPPRARCRNWRCNWDRKAATLRRGSRPSRFQRLLVITRGLSVQALAFASSHASNLGSGRLQTCDRLSAHLSGAEKGVTPGCVPCPRTQNLGCKPAAVSRELARLVESGRNTMALLGCGWSSTQ